MAWTALLLLLAALHCGMNKPLVLVVSSFRSSSPSSSVKDCSRIHRRRRLDNEENSQIFSSFPLSLGASVGVCPSPHSRCGAIPATGGTREGLQRVLMVGLTLIRSYQSISIKKVSFEDEGLCEPSVFGFGFGFHSRNPEIDHMTHPTRISNSSCQYWNGGSSDGGSSSNHRGAASCS
jgi:hypothetical protein